MMYRSFVAALCVAAAHQVAAQVPSNRPGVNLRLSRPAGVTARSNRLEPICDGSEMESVERKRSLGKTLIIVGGVVDLLGPSLASSQPTKAVPIVLAGTVTGLVGFYMRINAKPSDEFWQQTFSQLKAGRTKSADVRDCLRKPSSTSSSDAEETWTYYTQSIGIWGFGGSSKSVGLTFKNGILTNVRRSESGF